MMQLLRGASCASLTLVLCLGLWSRLPAEPLDVAKLLSETNLRSGVVVIAGPDEIECAQQGAAAGEFVVLLMAENVSRLASDMNMSRCLRRGVK